jgi:flagellar protein FliO/FliZ
MSLVEILRAFFGLSIVIGLILGLAYMLRRYAPALMAKLQAQRGAKRLEVIETLVLDPARRLVLVRLDNAERLILLGEGRELDAPGQAPQRSTPFDIQPASGTASVDPNDDLF